MRRLWLWLSAKIQVKLMASFAFIALIPSLLIGSILYSHMSGVAEKQTIENRGLLMRQVSQSIENYIHQYELFSQFIYQPPIQDILNRYPSGDLIRKAQMKGQLLDLMMEFYGQLGLNVSMQNVILIMPDGSIISKEPVDPSYPYLTSELYKQAMGKEGAITLFGPNDRPYRLAMLQDNAPTFSLSRKINNTLAHTELGVLLIDVRIDEISRLLDSLPALPSNLYILNAAGEYLYAQDHSIIGTKPDFRIFSGETSGWVASHGQSFFANEYASGKTGWTFLTLDPQAHIRQYSRQLLTLTLTIGFSALLIAIVLSVWISRKITRPLLLLQKNMRRIQTGHFGGEMPVAGSDEIGQLTLSFNRMSQKMDRLVNEVLKAELSEKEAHLKALRSQINPHFLYNTLDSMNAIAVKAGVPLLSRMAKMLADMFRYSVKQEQSLIPLFKELEQIDRYMSIQRIRYDDKFALVLDIPPEYLLIPIPKLSLQPVVENAIYHGLELSPKQGEIRISLFSEPERTVIRVCDNGIGMHPHKLQELQEHLARPDSGEHIGLFNVKERIQLEFGSEYGIAVESEAGRGTTVLLYLPRHIKHSSPEGGEPS